MLSFIYTEESIDLVKIFDFRFLMNFQELGCLEHDLTISGKCLSVSVCLCVCEKKFLASVAQELIDRIS